MVVTAFEDPNDPNVISFEFDTDNPEDVRIQARMILMGRVSDNPEYSPVGYYLIATDDLRHQVDTLCDLICDLISEQDEETATNEASPEQGQSLIEENVCCERDQPLYEALMLSLRKSVSRMEEIMKAKLKANDMDHLKEALEASQDGQGMSEGCSCCGGDTQG